MPRDPVENQALVAIVRRDLAPPFADPQNLLDEVIEETDPAALQRFRTEKFFPSAREARDQAADDEEAAARARARFAPQSLLMGHDDTTAVPAMTNWRAGVLGQVPFPFKIIAITISHLVDAAPGTVADGLWNVVVTPSATIDLGSYLAADKVVAIAQDFQFGVPVANFRIAGGAGGVTAITAGLIVARPGMFVHALHRAFGNFEARFTVEVEEIVAIPRPNIVFRPPSGRTNFNFNTGPTRTRGTKPPTPRAARLTVTFGGKIVNSRIVAWESLRSNIKRDWFNRQVGGEADPNIQWIP